MVPEMGIAHISKEPGVMFETTLLGPLGQHNVSRISSSSFRIVFTEGGSLGEPANLLRYVAFYSSGPWMRPRTGGSRLEDLDEIHGLIIESSNKNFIAIQAETSDESINTVFKLANGRIDLVPGKGWAEKGPLSAILTFVSPERVFNAFGGPDEYFGSPPLKSLFGFCTWNSFGLNFTEDDLLDASSSIRSATADPPGYILIDDGWQQVDSERRLVANTTNTRQFPQGLSGSVKRLRQAGVGQVWVWTAVLGYWNGLSVDFKGVETVEISRSNMTCLVPAPTSAGVDKYYGEFFAYLAAEGITGVKVDVMDSLQDLQVPEYNMATVYERYRAAIELAARKNHLGLIFCGGMVPWVLQHRAQGPAGPGPGVILRNSDDFFPNVDDSHRWHVYCNFVNSVYTRQFGVTLDFDMFQTSIAMAELHAAARIMSGGPIYVTDTPWKSNKKLLGRLILKDGSVPSFGGAPHITDPLAPYGGFLEAVQRHGRSRLVGVFDLNEKQGDLDDWIVAAPHGFASHSSVYYRVKLVTQAPLIKFGGKHVAVFGYVSVMSGIAAVESVSVNGSRLKVVLNSGGGSLGVQWPFCKGFARACGNDQEVHIENNLLVVEIPPSDPSCVVELSFEPYSESQLD